MKIGIILTVANVTGMLIIGVARLVIDSVWGLNAFGEISCLCPSSILLLLLFLKLQWFCFQR